VGAEAHPERPQLCRKTGERRRYLGLLLHRGGDAGHLLFRRAAVLRGPGGEAVGPVAGKVHRLGKVVVEDDVVDAVPPHRVEHAGVFGQDMGFQPDLHPHVRQEARADAVERGEDRLGLGPGAEAALPAPALGEPRGRDAVRGKLGRGGAQRLGLLEGRGGARGEVSLEPVAVEVHDAGEHEVARQVHLGRAVFGETAIGDRQVGVVKRAVAEHAGAGEPDRGQERHGEGSFPGAL
jgi:hypothetical protein